MTARPSVFFRTPLTCIPSTILRRTDGAGAVVPAALRRDNARRGAIYDVRCQNGTKRCGIALGGVRGGAGKFMILRRSSGRHKCRPYVVGCSSAESRRSSGRHKLSPYVAGCSSAALRRSSGRHKCRPYGAGGSSAILRRTVAVNGRRFRRRGRSLQTHDSSRNDRCRPAPHVYRPAH